MKYNFIILLFALFIIGCSSEEDSADTTPETFGNWTPAFTDQTSNFTQTRTGSKGSSESRNITVSSQVETEEENERTATFNLDLNGDGDFVDYVERTITTYTASNNLGSHTVTSDWSISFDQDASFFTLNYGRWFSQISLDGTPLFDYVLDMYDAFEDVDEHIKDAGSTCYDTSSLSEDLLYWESIAEYTEVESDDPTFLRIYIQGLPGEEFGVENELVDYILLWSTEDVAGNDNIEYAAAIRDYFEENLILAVVGDMSRQDDLEITVCTGKSPSSGKSLSDRKSLKDLLSNDPNMINKAKSNQLIKNVQGNK